MPQLPPEWTEHLSAGVSMRVGSCNRGGEPAIGRGLAAECLPDGRVRVLVDGRAGAEVLQGVRETGHVSLVLGLPATHRTLHLKGQDGVVDRAETAADHALLQRSFDAFAAQVATLGVAREVLAAQWYDLRWGDLWQVSFSIAGAWNQSPGPGAGQPLELRP